MCYQVCVERNGMQCIVRNLKKNLIKNSLTAFYQATIKSDKYNPAERLVVYLSVSGNEKESTLALTWQLLIGIDLYNSLSGSLTVIERLLMFMQLLGSSFSQCYLHI